MSADLLRILCCMTSSDTKISGVDFGGIESLCLRGSSGVLAHSEQRIDSSSCSKSGSIGLSPRIFRKTFDIDEVSGCLSARWNRYSSNRDSVGVKVSRRQGGMRYVGLPLSGRKSESGTTMHVIVRVTAWVIAAGLLNIDFSIKSF